MSRSLKRILKVRQLIEDQSRARLEVAMRNLADVERGIAGWQRHGSANRELARAAMIDHDPEERIAAEVEEGLSKWTIQRLRPVEDKFREQVAICREQFLELRKQTLQASSLLSKVEAEAEAERLRKAQKALDEWYQTERLRSQLEQERRSQKENTSAGPSTSSL
jgi:phosphoglycerate-specific signal transduction histidine kinase